MPITAPTRSLALILAGSLAAAASGQTSILGCGISGATIDGGSESGGAENVNIFLADVGQVVDENSQFTFITNGSSRSEVRHGWMQLQTALQLAYAVNDGSNEGSVWGALHTARGDFREELTLTWDEGFDPDQPIPVRFWRKATVPGGGGAVASSGLSYFNIDGQMRGRVLSGLIEGSSFNSMNYNVDEENYQSAPETQFADVVIANGGQVELYAFLTAKAQPLIRWNPEDPSLNVPDSRAGVSFFGTMWLEVPKGVSVSGAANVDWTVPPPVPACAADLDVDGLVGFSDLLEVLSGFGGTFDGDVTLDGATNFDDLLAVLSQWGTC